MGATSPAGHSSQWLTTHAGPLASLGLAVWFSVCSKLRRDRAPGSLGLRTYVCFSLFPHPTLLPHPPSPESSPHRRSPSQALFLGSLASDKHLLRQSLCQWPLRVTHHPPGQPLFRPGRGRGRWKANGSACPLPFVSAKGPSADCLTALSCDVFIVKRSRGSLVYRVVGLARRTDRAAMNRHLFPYQEVTLLSPAL